MGRLIYTSICSLDGYIADADGRFDWAFPTPEVHAFVNDLERPVGLYLYGRRLYEVMQVWETMAADGSPEVDDYARLWRAADKIVYSTTLTTVTTGRTRVETDFHPARVATLVADSPTDVSIGGGGLAAAALRAGLVDELRLIMFPVIVGGGTPALPTDVRRDLELAEHRRFGNGAVYLRYLVRH